MKVIGSVILFVVLAVFPLNAYALNQDWGGAEDDWSMPTGTSYNGPQATTCIADARKNQRCRDCKEKYSSNGQPTGVKVCAFVAEVASCGCKLNPTCDPYGSCVYLP